MRRSSSSRLCPSESVAHWLFIARWLLDSYTYHQILFRLLASAGLCAEAIALGTLVICLAAERAALKVALHSDIRGDLMRE